VILVEDDQVWVLDAVAKGIVVRKWEDWIVSDSKEWWVLRPSFFYVPEEQLVKDMRESVGTPYDFWALLTQAINILTFGLVWIGPTGEKAKKKLYCSEYWAYLYRAYFTDWFAVHTATILKRVRMERIDHGEQVAVN
jgi:hypothetical protein